MTWRKDLWTAHGGEDYPKSAVVLAAMSLYGDAALLRYSYGRTGTFSFKALPTSAD